MIDPDKTPNPEALTAKAVTLESINADLKAQRDQQKRFEEEIRRRLNEIERADIVGTVNMHSDKIIELELGQMNIIEALDELKAESVKTQTWLTGIEKKTDDTNDTVHRTETMVQRMFSQLTKK